jgi:hypothetical protein
MGKGRGIENVKWTDFDRTLSAVPYPEALEIDSVSHEGFQFRQQWMQLKPYLPEKPKKQDEHRTDWENDYLLFTLLCRDKVDDHYSSRILQESAKSAKAAKAAKAARKDEPEVVKEQSVEETGKGPEWTAPTIKTLTEDMKTLDGEGARLETLEKFFDEHAADMVTMEQVVHADPAFERLRRARARRPATVPASYGGQPLSDLGIPGIDGEVGVKIRRPYVKGALESARRAVRQKRRADLGEARVASEVRKAEQVRVRPPSGMSGESGGSQKSQVPVADFNAKKDKPHKPRTQRVSILDGKDKVEVENAIELSPALDLICAEDDGFVQLDKVSDGIFRYEVRLANGRKVENLFDIFAENRVTAEAGIKDRQTKEEEKRGKKDESILVADAVMKPSAQLRGNLGWDIELFPSPSAMFGKQSNWMPGIAKRRHK